MSVIRMTDLDLSGKRVLIREDLNVPVADGVVTSDARIQAALPTIEAALAANAAVMLVSHLGRPTEGQPEAQFSLRPVAARLVELLGRDVPLIDDWIEGVDVEPGNVVLLENVRFLAGEKACDEALSRKMAALCDVFVMGPGQHLRCCRVRSCRLCRAATRPGARGPRQGADGPGAALRGDRRRVEGIDEAARARCALRHGRHAHRGRRHRQHAHRGGRP